LAYATQNDLQLRVTDQELQQLTDDDRSGAIDADVVSGVIDEASAIVDSYCRDRYVVPLQESTDATRITRDIAIYLLYSRRPQKMQDTVRQRYEDAMALLKDISTGKASLDQPADAPAPQSTTDGGSTPRYDGRRMTERDLEGFC
jgi:phage gp36-like protein